VDHVDEHHYAFLLAQSEYAAAFGRIKDAGLTHYADPACRHPWAPRPTANTPPGW
jgi:hypothetical protein